MVQTLNLHDVAFKYSMQTQKAFCNLSYNVFLISTKRDVYHS